MALWWHWFEGVQLLRAACTRRRTFLWMVLVLAGLSMRSDRAGVSSIIRALGLKGACYRRLLYLCHSPGLAVERLQACWARLVLRLFLPERIGGRLVLIGDGLKVAKEGRKMPAVKKLHQCSANNSKAAYIFGHSFQALGLLARGPAGHLRCVPLAGRIHEGLVFTNRDRRTLLDKFVQMVRSLGALLEAKVLLIADAYYASRKVLRPLLERGHHLVSRVRSNAVAYHPALPPERVRRGRHRTYGEKLHLREQWSQGESFHTAASPVYGETGVTLRYAVRDLLWRPIGQLVRFVWVDHPVRGRLILISSDLTLSALEIIAAYGYRFKIELAFKQALYTLGSYGYHFWMMAMKPRPRRRGNQYLHRTSDDYRRLVRRKLDAYHRHVLLGCIAQGLLQYLALYHHTLVWQRFGSWLRTMNPARPPSEAVVAQALRNTLPEFLADSPEDCTFKKFLLEQTDFERCPALLEAA
jgi:hypothetical protein